MLWFFFNIEELEAERRLRQKMELELENLRMKVNERQLREVQEVEKTSIISKLREDLQKAAKLRDEMEGEWSQLCDDSQVNMAIFQTISALCNGYHLRNH